VEIRLLFFQSCLSRHSPESVEGATAATLNGEL